jgi:hypothetical protein
VPLNVTGQNTALDGLDESVATGIKFIGINTLVTAPPTDTTPGTGSTPASTEATGGSPAYGRLAVVWGAGASGLKTGSSGTLTFDVPAGTYGFFTLWNVVGPGTTGYLGYLPFGGATPIKGFGSVDATDLTNNTITSVAHGLVNGDRVLCFNVFAESLPTSITEGAAYFVVGAATDTFQISNTLGGAAIDLITTGGELYFQKVVPEVFGSQGQITVAANQLVLDATGV